MQRLRIQAGQQREIADHHQALDVVRMRLRQGLSDGIGQAAHAHAAGPEPIRQGRVVAEVIERHVAGHLRPVHATDVFAPSQDLADEALHRRQRRMSRTPCGLGARDHLGRMQHLGVQGEREQRVEQARRLGAHRILVLAEPGQCLFAEGVQIGQRLVAVQRPAQRIGLRSAEAGHARGLDGAPQGAVIVWPAPVRGRGRRAGPGGTVVLVEVPASAGRRPVGFQQHAQPASHVAVEGFHAPLPACTEQLTRLVARGEEVHVRRAFHRDGERGRPVAQLRVQSPLVRGLVGERRGAVEREQRVQVLRQPLAVAGVVDGDIADPVTLRAQAGGEGTHGREDRQDLLCVVQHVVGFLPHLHHHVQDAGIHPSEPGMLRVQLVAEDQAERMGGRRAPPVFRGRHFRWLRCRRQRSEQCATSSQISRHLRRHVNGRPQVRQGLLGRSDLRRMAGVAAVYRLLRTTLPHGCARAIRDHLAQRVYGWLASARL